jgi:hypothetical protein
MFEEKGYFHQLQFGQTTTNAKFGVVCCNHEGEKFGQAKRG